VAARICILSVVVLSLFGKAAASRDIPADAYYDKLHGMWLGQILGNYAGRPTEGAFCIRGGNPAGNVDWNSFIHTDPWVGDDDTCFEYMYMHLLAGNSDPSGADVKAAWEAHVPLDAFYIANRQARYLMTEGLTPPATGSIRKNMHWYAIDSQITTESLGAAAPGMRQRAADLAGRFGSVSNDGYPVHAAQFYAAMYAAAAFEMDVETIVQMGLEVVPTTSRTHQVVQDVVDWYDGDKADGTLDWRATQEKIYDHYVGAYSSGRYRYWIESTVNTGMTTLAILYGQGDFKETVKVGVLAGFDCDCNPATAGGLIGLIRGYSGLPADLTSQAADAYHVPTLANISPDTTISDVAVAWRGAAEGQILLAGGSISGEGLARTYHLPEGDEVLPPPEKPDPPGPAGLVGSVLDAGGSAWVSSSVEAHDPDNDRQNLDAIIDGIVDVSHNGHLPYTTYDGDNAQPAGGDFYQINFDRDVTFTSLVFHEGDIRWSAINADPRLIEPRGGYFLDLIVEVGDDGAFTEVGGLQLDEPLDPYEYFQRIELSFTPIVGDAIRIRGPAGGTAEFTSIVELEAYGLLPAVILGDATGDGAVDGGDYTVWADHYASQGVARFSEGGWAVGNFNQDTTVDGGDYTIWADNYLPAGGRQVGGAGTGPAGVPEPGTILLVALGGVLALVRRR